MNNKNSDIAFSGIVVTLNEEKYLRRCLDSLSFCDQLIVVDLGSTDNSIEIAKECGAEIMVHEKKPIVEQIIPNIIPHTKHDWIIKLDPDEIFSPQLLSDVNRLAENPNIGQISVPFQFYFRNKPLTSTFWGTIKHKPMIFNRQRVKFTPHVHKGIILLNGFESAKIERGEGNYVRHNWMDSYRQLFEKHNRYIVFEGESRFNNGERFSWIDFPEKIWKALKYNLIRWKGLRGGWDGIFLSFFYTWYVLRSLLSLRKYQKNQQNLSGNLPRKQ